MNHQSRLAHQVPGLGAGAGLAGGLRSGLIARVPRA